MILKKPYAFLIRHFKLFHIIMSIFTIYIIYKTNNIASFFRNYVYNNYSAVITENFAEKFVNSFLFFSTVIVLIVLIALVYLMIYKKKKLSIYYFATAFYIILIIAIIFYNGVLSSLEENVIAAETARLYRDITWFIYLPQFLFIAIFIVRSFGFNIKQFNFNSDLKELEITADDNEEVEVNIEFDTSSAQRNLRRYKREFKYYILENKFIIIIISISLISLITYNIVKTETVYGDNNYSMNQNFYNGNLQYSILGSYITNVDLSGNIIKEDKYYLVLQVNIINETSYDVNFDPNHMKISYNGKSITPSLNTSKKFIDYGEILPTSKIKLSTNKIYNIPYEINADDIKNTFELSIYKNTITTNSVNYQISDNVRLENEIISDNLLIGAYNKGEKLLFADTVIGESTLVLNEYEYTNIYYYDVENCVNEKCTTYKDSVYLNPVGSDSNKTLMIMDLEYELDNTTYYSKQNSTIEDFFNNFVSIAYTVNGEEIIEKVSSIKNDDINSKVIIKVPKNIESLENEELVINIRNMEYRIKLN